jgi:hypothetical protein
MSDIKLSAQPFGTSLTDKFMQLKAAPWHFLWNNVMPSQFKSKPPLSLVLSSKDTAL